MLPFHDTFAGSLRTCCAANAQADSSTYQEQDYFAGYCLDAVEVMPAGSTQRINPGSPDPYLREPFATPSRWYRYI
jgi:hypothetical protein